MVTYHCKGLKYNQEVTVTEVSVTKVCISSILYLSNQLWTTSIERNPNGDVHPMKQFN